MTKDYQQCSKMENPMEKSMGHEMEAGIWELAFGV